MPPAKSNKKICDVINLDALFANVQGLLPDASLSSIFGPLTPKKHNESRGFGREVERLLYSSGEIRPYIPIEWFRNPAQYLQPIASVKTYRSSGTVSADRAVSAFSDEGMTRYKGASVLSFLAVMEELVGGSFPSMRGISLVSRATDLPESSLAEMVSWIGEFTDLSFCDAREQILREQIDPNTPCWIFGTAFDFVNLIDNSEGDFPLHPGSVLIETGGTKGKSRSIGREEFYGLLAATFKICPDRIVSEYGMAELASQAYDWVSPREVHRSVPTKLSERKFRFPCWIEPLVLATNGEGATSGTGCLVVGDLARFDYPTLIRTQDLASLNEDGRFNLLGRAPSSPLKGCSLSSERPNALSNFLQPETPTHYEYDQAKKRDPLTIKRASKILETLSGIISSKNWQNQLGLELGSARCAEYAAVDLLSDLPQCGEEFFEAAMKAIAGSAPTSENWLFIAPSTHSVALIYPIAIACFLDFKLTIRLHLNQDSTSLILDKLRKYFAFEPQVVASSELLISNDGDLDRYDGVLVYGGDETVKHISSLTSKAKVSGFGSFSSVAIINVNDLSNHPDLVVKDVFSLAQRGCLSAICLFIVSDGNDLLAREFEPIRKAFDDFWNSEFSANDLYSAEFLDSKLLPLGARRLYLGASNLAVILQKYEKNWANSMSTLMDYRYPFTLLAQTISTQHDDIIDIIDANDQVALSPEVGDRLGPLAIDGSKIRALGQLNRHSWDGTWNNRPLFSSI